MQSLNLFNYDLKILSYKEILEYILKNKGQNRPASQIISLNPENMMAMKRDPAFEKIVLTSYGQIVDGIGIVLAARVLKSTPLVRLSGVDLMDRLLREGSEYRLRYLLIGGRSDLANKVAKCYKQVIPDLEIAGIEGIRDLKRPNEPEIRRLKQIVASTRPHLIFVAFGSPQQELWIEEHLDLFRGSLVIGVGGAFEMLSGAIARAPSLVRKMGFEWLYRLIREPWRLKRQLALGEFLLMLLKFKLLGK